MVCIVLSVQLALRFLLEYYEWCVVPITICLPCGRVTVRAGLKPMQPMQLHWAPRHGVWEGYSFSPDTHSAREFSENGLQTSLLANN